MGYSKYITYDPDIESNFKYYTGILFKVYTYGVGDSICKGGRYNSLLEKYGEGAPAVGCVFMIDNILQSLKKQKINVEDENNSKTFVVYKEGAENEAVNKARELRESGVPCVTVSDSLFNDELKKKCEENDYRIIIL